MHNLTNAEIQELVRREKREYAARWRKKNPQAVKRILTKRINALSVSRIVIQELRVHQAWI